MSPIKNNATRGAVVTRFAPSPTGELHTGHAYSALFAEAAAKRHGGKLLLRIEDIDQSRCRPEFERAIIEDLSWLGLRWESPVRRQSDCMETYREALQKLSAMGLLYPCFCSRKEIQAELARAGHAPHADEQAPPYPGTCRSLDGAERQRCMDAGQFYALRLHMEAAMERTGRLTWRDRARGRIDATPEDFGDVVLARKDTPTSYHLASTIDDHIQGVSLVTRGDDLFTATHIHRVLQALLDLDVPEYHHHELITGDDGKRLAKRDKALTLRALRDAGQTPDEVRRSIGAEFL